MGTHVFTAMEYLADNSTFRWNVVSMPAETAKAAVKARASWQKKSSTTAMAAPMNGRSNASITMTIRRPPTRRRRKRRNRCWRVSTCRRMPSISFPQRMVPGSSLIVSDQGLGDETGEGTDFIVVTH